MSDRFLARLLLIPSIVCLVASVVVLSIRAEPARTRRAEVHTNTTVLAPPLPASEVAPPNAPPTREATPATTTDLDLTLEALRCRRISMDVSERDLDEILARIRFETGVEIRRVDPDRNCARMTLSFCEASLGNVLDVIAGMNLLTCALGDDGVIYVGSAEAIGRERRIGEDAVLLSSLGWNRVSMH